MSPRLYNIGQVLVVPARLSNPYHAHRVEYPQACGRARVEALTQWRAGTLPPTLVVWGVEYPHPGAERIGPDRVDWSTSGIASPTDAPVVAVPDAPVVSKPTPTPHQVGKGMFDDHQT